MSVLFKFLGIFLVLNLVLFQFNKAEKIEKCDLCKKFVQEFIDGLKRTSKGNFGGGNTAWEDKKLGNYLTSETRFEEIVEKMCKNSDIDDCSRLLEEQEENLFNWYKSKQKQIESDLQNEMCINLAKQCCPLNHFGSKCLPCLKHNDLVCSSNGDCNGDGKRDGDGTCTCHSGYTGKLCNICQSRFYQDQESKNDTRIVCSECDEACLTCTGPDRESCTACNSGWKYNENKLCDDVNECLEENICTKDEYCKNTIGSFQCNKCDSSCVSCLGEGSDKCVGCKSGYRLSSSNVCEDIDECLEGADHCSSENKKCFNLPGSFKCLDPKDRLNNNKDYFFTSENMIFL